jgi:hypothetical protein
LRGTIHDERYRIFLIVVEVLWYNLWPDSNASEVDNFHSGGIMKPDVKAQEIYQRIGDYSPQTAIERSNHGRRTRVPGRGKAEQWEKT